MNAGVAQLVERNLAKVEVASSNLVSRSMWSSKAGEVGKKFEEIWAVSIRGIIPALHVGEEGSSPSRSTSLRL
jgi:hypothetical protein